MSAGGARFRLAWRDGSAMLSPCLTLQRRVSGKIQGLGRHEGWAMIEFTSKVGGAVSLLTPDARQLLGVLGKDAAAVHGVITPAQLSAAIVALEAAGRAQADTHRAALAAREQRMARDQQTPEDEQGPPVSLTQRAFPLLELLRRAEAAGEPVLWGV